jgi:Phage terminase, small subunit
MSDTAPKSAAQIEARMEKLTPALGAIASPLALDLLRQYCVAAVEADEAQEQIDKLGAVVKSGDKVVVSPYVTVRDLAYAAMARLAERLGLDGVDRRPTTAPERQSRQRGTKGGGRGEQFSVEAVKTALRKSSGVYTGAAALLKCAPNTVRGYVERHKTLQVALLDIEEENLDLAETVLQQRLRNGEAWAICFYLKCKGKLRGWTERAEVTGPNGGPVQTQAIATVIEIPSNGRGR